MFMPHQIVEQRLQKKFDDDVRKHYFRGMEFAGPTGDPGWFGPGSPVWHVHSHMPTLIFGLQCAAYLERLDPSIYWMGVHHSRLVKRDESSTAPPRLDPKGLSVRLGHSIAFFIGTAYGSTATAERLAQTVRAMHHTIKGVRPDGAAYDADDPDWLRWNHATVVWGLATAHEIYHPNPLRGKKLDTYYGEFVRVGHALGGSDLPATKAETLDCLESLSPTAGAHPRRGDVDRAQPAHAAERAGLGDPRHHAQVGAAADPAPAAQPGRARRPSHRGVVAAQRAPRRGRTDTRIRTGKGQGGRRDDGSPHSAHARARDRSRAQP
ncbi:oxygenase MpaB family protein [Mycobacterium sp. NPDC006124]|uniref:oxygenase MpaB family protein n=1 Tax=Mycobacterium sp. NPDC006124 TaxID=3156729 RepID=UPI0033B82DE9